MIFTAVFFLFHCHSLVHISLPSPNFTTLFAPVSQITLWSSSSSTLPSFLPAKANTGSLQRLYDPALTSAALSHVHIWKYLGNTNTNVIQRSFVQLLLSYRIFWLDKYVCLFVCKEKCKQCGTIPNLSLDASSATGTLWQIKYKMVHCDVWMTYVQLP